MPVSLGIWDRLPVMTQKRLSRWLHPAVWGTMRHTRPLSTRWGKDRGTPIDRYYIDRFLSGKRADMHGRVLEVGGNTYTQRFGTNLEQCDILDNNPANPQATLIANLEQPLEIASNQYDSLVLTQVLQFVFNLPSCISELERILKPGGILLATVPAVSRIDPSYGLEKDYWRFTPSAIQMLFEKVFGKGPVQVVGYGNVLSCVAFLEGQAYEELKPGELDAVDPLYPCLIGVRAEKKC